MTKEQKEFQKILERTSFLVERSIGYYYRCEFDEEDKEEIKTFVLNMFAKHGHAT